MKIESIGPGETAWRPEPDGPAGMGALAGAAREARLIVVIPKKGLGVYDITRRVWQLVHPPSIPRSCQMTALRGAIWMIGGVDTRPYRHKASSLRSSPGSRLTRSYQGAGSAPAGVDGAAKGLSLGRQLDHDRCGGCQHHGIRVDLWGAVRLTIMNAIHGRAQAHAVACQERIDAAGQVGGEHGFSGAADQYQERG